MPTTSNMGLILPVEGDTDNTWDTLLNAALIGVDGHDHTDGNGVPVPTAGLSINADLTFGGNAATSLKAARFTSQASGTGLNTGIWVKTSNGELYWRNASGTDVQITDGSGLNMSLVGGITGDYSTTDADLNYSDADGQFRFWSDNTTTPETWAAVATEQHDIYPAGNGLYSVGLQAPAGLAASYAFKLPTGLPAATELLTLSSAGNLVVLGTRTYAILAATGTPWVGTWTETFRIISPSAASDLLGFALPLEQGNRIRSVTFYYNRGGGTITFGVRRLSTVGVVTDVATGTDNSTSGDTSKILANIDHTIVTGYSYFIDISAGDTADAYYQIVVSYDRV
jgi:hypothetical protein